MSVVGDPSNQLFDNYRKFYKSEHSTDSSRNRGFAPGSATTAVPANDPDRRWPPGHAGRSTWSRSCINILLNLWAIPRWRW